ncbi:MAG: hypothetical protein R3F58_01180 [Steroidobacteraceae bacterium]
MPENLGPLDVPAQTRGSTDVLGPMCQLNEQFLDLLLKLGPPGELPAASQSIPLTAALRSLGPATIASAARFPFLLLDVRFTDNEWWQQVSHSPTRRLPEPQWLVTLPRASAIKLSREALMLAWHTIRTDLRSAVVLLGIAQPVTELVATFRLRDLDRIAEHQFRHLRPRWEDRPGVWRQLIACAASGKSPQRTISFFMRCS